jgi:hypothetical protein
MVQRTPEGVWNAGSRNVFIISRTVRERHSFHESGECLTILVQPNDFKQTEIWLNANENFTQELHTLKSVKLLDCDPILAGGSDPCSNLGHMNKASSFE